MTKAKSQCRRDLLRQPVTGILIGTAGLGEAHGRGGNGVGEYLRNECSDPPPFRRSGLSGWVPWLRPLQDD